MKHLASSGLTLSNGDRGIARSSPVTPCENIWRKACAMSDVRTCTADDMPAVARMFQKAFRDPNQAAPPSLEAYLRELFLEHPWRDPETASRVFVGADGGVHGF